MQDDAPSGSRVGGESQEDFPSGSRVGGGIPEQPNDEIAVGEAVQPPPGLEYVTPTAKQMARPEKYKPSHRLVGKQPPPIVAMLDE
eukprot:3036254-Amphidinium_carterae.1